MAKLTEIGWKEFEALPLEAKRPYLERPGGEGGRLVRDAPCHAQVRRRAAEGSRVGGPPHGPRLRVPEEGHARPLERRDVRQRAGLRLSLPPDGAFRGFALERMS